jgi:RNA polymerase sigma-70 factor (ECF subfamily)
MSLTVTSTASQSDPRSDDELIAIANGAGNDAAAAFESLYARYRDWVHALAFRFTRNQDTALDVTQEVFIYFLRKFPGFKLTARLTTFLYPAIKNLAIAHREKSYRFSSNDEVLAGVPDRSIEEGHAKRAELAGVMESLSEGHREVLLLRFVDGLSLQEVAAALEVPVGTVKSRIHNALNTLRSDPRARNYFEP